MAEGDEVEAAEAPAALTAETAKRSSRLLPLAIVFGLLAAIAGVGVTGYVLVKKNISQSVAPEAEPMSEIQVAAVLPIVDTPIAVMDTQPAIPDTPIVAVASLEETLPIAVAPPPKIASPQKALPSKRRAVRRVAAVRKSEPSAPYLTSSGRIDLVLSKPFPVR